MAHEVAHAYLSAIGKVCRNLPKEEEYEADMIAYHILLKIIMEEKNNIIIDEYTYLAPMMFMDFVDLYYYTDRVLYNSVFIDENHPLLKKRKERLFAIADKKEYYFNNTEGNCLYNGFLDVYKEYREQILLKMQRGKLENILRIKKREQMREKRK